MTAIAVKSSLKRLFTFFYSLSRLFQLAYFVQMLANSPEAEAVQWTPTARKCLKKNIHKKGRCFDKFRAFLCFISLIHTTWGYDIPYEISCFPSTVFCVMIWRYFSLGCRAFRNFQGWPKQDKMSIFWDSVSNIHWRSKCARKIKLNTLRTRHYGPLWSSTYSGSAVRPVNKFN